MTPVAYRLRTVADQLRAKFPRLAEQDVLAHDATSVA